MLSRSMGLSIDRFVNLVECDGYQPSVARQNLLIAPLPMPQQLYTAEDIVWPEERVVLDEFFAREAVPVALLCKSKTWQPGKEDYRIEIGLSGLNHRRKDIRLVCVFASIQPADLLELFARLSGEETSRVNPDRDTLDELAELRAKALLLDGSARAGDGSLSVNPRR